MFEVKKGRYVNCSRLKSRVRISEVWREESHVKTCGRAVVCVTKTHLRQVLWTSHDR